MNKYTIIGECLYAMTNVGYKEGDTAYDALLLESKRLSEHRYRNDEELIEVMNNAIIKCLNQPKSKT